MTGALVTFSGINPCCVNFGGFTGRGKYDYSAFNGNTYFLSLLDMRPTVAARNGTILIGADLIPLTKYSDANCTTATTTDNTNNTATLRVAFDCRVGVVTQQFEIDGSGGAFMFDASIPTPPTITTAYSNICACGSLHGGSVNDAGDSGSVTIEPLFTNVVLNSTSQSFTNAGGTGSVSFTADDDWYASAPAVTFPTTSGNRLAIGTLPVSSIFPVTITSATSGTAGSNTLNYSVPANSTGSAKTTGLCIQDKYFQITVAA